ncbi:LysR family transcriptional regulator [Pigmentiphaga soli]|uniref:LysR family transcriptional regulator n=1 Tax=Pigmentiphaga soli TaxID=1007095 RepID=A0ABP8HMJ3_9BURK
MNTSGFDLNLLPVFEALFEEQSVTRAGTRLGMSQATVSNALRRMRNAAGDPLFVRVKGVMVPTPYAELMAQKLVPAIRLIRDGLSPPDEFDARRSERVFTLLMSDVVQHRVLPALATYLREHGPRIEIRVGETARETYVQELESGRADLAIGHFEELQTGFYQQRLFEDRHVCVAGRAYEGPEGNSLTMEQYLAARHLVVSSSRTDAYIDRQLANKGCARRVAIRASSYLVIAELMRHTDLLVTMSSRSGLFLCGAEYRQYELPLALPPVNVRQFWHMRNHEDPASRWLRRTIAELGLRSAAQR